MVFIAFVCEDLQCWFVIYCENSSAVGWNMLPNSDELFAACYFFSSLNENYRLSVSTVNWGFLNIFPNQPLVAFLHFFSRSCDLWTVQNLLVLSTLQNIHRALVVVGSSIRRHDLSLCRQEPVWLGDLEQLRYSVSTLRSWWEFVVDGRICYSRGSCS
jgi:hypothetical protein